MKKITIEITENPALPNEVNVISDDFEFFFSSVGKDYAIKSDLASKSGKYAALVQSCKTIASCAIFISTVNNINSPEVESCLDEAMTDLNQQL